MKIDDVWPKPLMTQSLGDLIPKDCVFRPKLGFTFPFETWLRSNQFLNQRMVDTFRGTPNTTLPFRAESLNEIWGQFEAGKISWGRVWYLFVLIQWLEEHNIS